MRDAVLTGGNALPKDDPPDVTRFKSAGAKRLHAHRARARMGLRCLTVRVSDCEVRRRSRSLLRPGFTTISPEPRQTAIIAGFGTCFAGVSAAAVEREGYRLSYFAARRSRLPRGGPAASAQVTAFYPPCGPVSVEAAGSVRKAGPKRRALPMLLRSWPRAAWR
jgi:hypothetical protein